MDSRGFQGYQMTWSGAAMSPILMDQQRVPAPPGQQTLTHFPVPSPHNAFFQQQSHSAPPHPQFQIPPGNNHHHHHRPATHNPGPPAPPAAVPKRAQTARTVPSAESGGVPDPTPEYLRRSSFPALLLPSPRKILVVIDLNGTLLWRPKRRNATSFVARPHASAFLDYCLRTFRVAIWSSAKPDNVAAMVAQLLGGMATISSSSNGGDGGKKKKKKKKRQQQGEQEEEGRRGKLVAVWGRDRFGLSKADYNERVQCYKRLSWLWRDPGVMASHPEWETSGGTVTWGQEDTVLIDDSAEKARTEPHNLIEIPEFFGDGGGDGHVLPQVHDYINACSQQANVSAFIRSNPFRIDKDYSR